MILPKMASIARAGFAMGVQCCGTNLSQPGWGAGGAKKLIEEISNRDSAEIAFHRKPMPACHHSSRISGKSKSLMNTP